MKWAFLFFALLSILPLSVWLRHNPQHTPKIWVVMGLLPFALEPFHLYMAIVSWAFWPGFVKGMEVSVIDVLALAFLMSLPRTRISVPFYVVTISYFCAVLLSTFQAGVPEAAFFYLWQLARMFLLFAVVAKACADERVASSLMGGMAIGICFEACLVIWQRFVLGELQADGTFGHQNALGLGSHFVTFPFFALLLAGKRRTWEASVVPIAGVIIALLTVSRATLGLGGLGYATVFVLSAVRKWTSRKGWIAFAGTLALAALAPLAIASFETRFAANPISGEYDERAAFETAAVSILSDHPMGIGANNYVVVANTGGYNERAKVLPSEGSLSAHVHNVYLLVAAETGYFGLITFVLLLIQPLAVAFVWGWRSRRDVRGDVLLGLGVSLFIVYVHSFFEWVFVTYNLQYFFALELGLIAGLAQQLGHRRKLPLKNPKDRETKFSPHPSP